MRDVAARHDAAIASGVPESEVWIATAEDMTDLVVDLLRVQRQQMRARAFAEHGALLDRIAEAEHRAEVAEREHRMLQRHHELTLSGRLGVRNMIALTVARDRVVEALSAKLDAAERDVDRLLAAIEKMENTK